MSWNNVIPAELLLGNVELKPKTVENPEVSIPEELVTDCLVKYSIDDYGITGTQDHPAFAELRKVLSGRGYIEIPPYACSNGDRVLKRFQFNGFQLEPGDKFYCAGAWATQILMRKRKHETNDHRNLNS
jgi:hypothetical protein